MKLPPRPQIISHCVTDWY